MAVERSGANFDVDMLRWAIALYSNFGDNHVVYEDIEEFDNEIDNYIERNVVSGKERETRFSKQYGIRPDYRHYDNILDDDDVYDDDDNNYGGDFAASSIGYGIVIVPALFLFLALSGVFAPSQEEIEERQRERETIAYDGCVERTESQLTRSCAADPVFTYCSMMYDSYEIIGSGCTSRVKNKGEYSEQIEFCESEVLSGVRRMCAIEVYGCVAVTGDINCN